MAGMKDRKFLDAYDKSDTSTLAWEVSQYSGTVDLLVELHDGRYGFSMGCIYDPTYSTKKRKNARSALMRLDTLIFSLHEARDAFMEAVNKVDTNTLLDAAPLIDLAPWEPEEKVEKVKKKKASVKASSKK